MSVDFPALISRITNLLPLHPSDLSKHHLQPLIRHLLVGENLMHRFPWPADTLIRDRVEFRYACPVGSGNHVAGHGRASRKTKVRRVGIT